jgi:hypothetical protein
LLPLEDSDLGPLPSKAFILIHLPSSTPEHPKNTLTPTAVGSDYFSFCFPLHIPPTSDLVLVELAVNDDGSPEHTPNMENLLRGLLAMDAAPAVIMVEAVAFSNGGMGGGGGRMHLPVAQYYGTSFNVVGEGVGWCWEGVEGYGNQERGQGRERVLGLAGPPRVVAGGHSMGREGILGFLGHGAGL